MVRLDVGKELEDVLHLEGHLRVWLHRTKDLSLNDPWANLPNPNLVVFQLLDL